MDINWITKLRSLRVDRASSTPAPHKAILLLVLIDEIERGSLDPSAICLTPQIAFQFLAYWELVASRGRSIGRVELPFFYLKSDGVLQHTAKAGLDAALKAVRPTSVDALNAVIEKTEMPRSLFEFLTDSENRGEARHTLIDADWFLPDEKWSLREMFGFAQQDFPISQDKLSENPTARGKGREARFRLTIVPLYRYTCALCGLKTITPSGLTLVEAAHIHQFAVSQNNNPDNGIALCRNHHWAFDAGLWSLNESFTVIVAKSLFEEYSPLPNKLADYEGRLLDFSSIAKELRPNPEHFNWHRDQKFQG
jgi:putative restriction endonuclease